MVFIQINMRNKKLLFRLKILSSLILSFLIVNFVAPQIFVRDTSAMKPKVQAVLKIVPYTMYAYIRYPFDSQARDKAIELAFMQQLPLNKDLSYRQISKGVYAAEDETTEMVHVKVESRTQLEAKTITLNNGQTLKIFVPIK
ncbi:hypothetical protein A3A93_06040 [Candidatus Roizmanbacteria bacterium RIFCSPLOWO2_01_FULL_38_12]|uniref:Uncharacterized protein n=1 Tax=Candidatus Roizmanbacteria bacterium RIFCSPLOWO2_01_FULL_38_12 TaxID=1802061 RepID=A0A1F7IVD3_9BACT|nr:MAG: hypothetical protein A2861_03040 [Candidatus Roizmanbacteria bacterium RIFCSPHIGHO2_01_FULL_38_15]OGK36279.1 MAG: hypothetical protein A3F59_00180 [Candidatus Roizmanbacteria bacterium RIFCSPHIGHO2_12_FULL_38_13]OGK47318.1 MAG: hypothetical protein A3A93_06040 [Candidatus Roizmanbacteria bacterium RIFCSPLOWO2_01_FULL_38_12]